VGKRRHQRNCSHTTSRAKWHCFQSKRVSGNVRQDTAILQAANNRLA
jgi:hypothetical protein